MNINDIREKYPQYKDLSDEKLADGLHGKFYADMPKEDFYSKIGFSIKPTERTWSEAGKDTVNAISAGVGDLTALAGKGVALITGNPDNIAIREGEKFSKRFTDDYSAPFKQKQQAQQKEIDAVDGEWNKLYKTLETTVADPALGIEVIARSLPNLALTGGVGRTASALSTIAKVGNSAKIGTGAAIGTGATLQGVDVGESTYQELIKLDDNVWNQSPDYQELIKNGVNPQEAKHTLSLEIGRLTGLASGALSAGLNSIVPSGNITERVLSGNLNLGKGGISGALKGGLKGTLGESLTEGLEEGGGKFAQNIGVQQIDSNQSLTQGVGQATGTGLFAGGVMGGATGTVEGAIPNQQPQSQQQPMQPIQKTPDEILATPMKDLIAEIKQSKVFGETKAKSEAIAVDVGDINYEQMAQENQPEMSKPIEVSQNLDTNLAVNNEQTPIQSEVMPQEVSQTLDNVNPAEQVNPQIEKLNQMEQQAKAVGNNEAVFNIAKEKAKVQLQKTDGRHVSDLGRRIEAMQNNLQNAKTEREKTFYSKKINYLLKRLKEQEENNAKNIAGQKIYDIDAINEFEGLTKATGMNTADVLNLEKFTNTQGIRNAITRYESGKATKRDFEVLDAVDKFMKYEGDNFRTKVNQERYKPQEEILPDDLKEQGFKQLDTGEIVDENGNLLFSKGKEDTKDLLIQHNLSEDNLKYARKGNGLTVPSLAITKGENPLAGFGEITLLGDKDLANPKGYAKTKVFGADIYSPRYPREKREYKSSDIRKMDKELEKYSFALQDGSISRDDDVSDLVNNKAMQLKFLNEVKGINPEIPTKKNPNEEVISKFYPDEYNYSIQNKGIDWTSLYKDENFKQKVVADLKAKFAERGKDLDPLAAYGEDGINNIARERAQTIDQIGRSQGKPDFYAMRKILRNEIAKYDNEFNDYVDNFKNKYDYKSFFYDNGKKKKFDENTILKYLTSNLRGGENFNYGTGNIRAVVTPEYKTIEQIKKAKEKLVSSEEFEPIKDSLNNQLLEIAGSIASKGGNPFTANDIAVEFIQDYAKRGRRAINDYDVNVNDESLKKVNEFLDLLKEMPTEYFEAKITRNVQPSEFKAAIVPDSISQDALDYLTKQGLKIKTYKSGDEADRKRAIQEASKEHDLLFSQFKTKDNTTTEEAINQTKKLLGKKFDKVTKNVEFIQSINELPQDIKDALQSVTAYHGTPHNVDKFSTKYIGSGEGAQAYGWGMYFADSKKVAEFYRNNLSDGFIVNGKEVIPTNKSRAMYEAAFKDKKELEEHIKYLEEEINSDKPKYYKEEKLLELEKAKALLNADIKKKGNLYKVELKPNEDEFLHWDKPLSEQSEKVQNALNKMNKDFGDIYNTLSDTLQPFENTDGGGIYRALERDAGNAKNASMDLEKYGIKGIKYLDGNSRSKQNYTVTMLTKDGEVYAKNEWNSKQEAEQYIQDKKEQGYEDSGFIFKLENNGDHNYVIFADENVGKPEILMSGGIPRGIFDPQTNKIYLIADTMKANEVQGVMLHELLHRAINGLVGKGQTRLDAILGSNLKPLTDRLLQLSAQGDKAVAQAFKRVKSAGVPKANQLEETMSYLLENHTNDKNASPALVKWISDVIQAIRNFIRKVATSYGIDPNWFISRMNPQDIASVLRDTAINGKDALTKDNILASKKSRLEEWHKDSSPETKNVDRSPKVFYHGTETYFEEFKPSKNIGTHGETDQIEGIYFTTNKDAANWYALEEDNDKYLKQVYLLIKKPFVAKTHNDLKEKLNLNRFEEAKSKLEKLGYDGVIIEDGFYTRGLQKLYIAFKPTQIKSVNNQGTFDETNPNILYSKEAVEQREKTRLETIKKWVSDKAYDLKSTKGIGALLYVTTRQQKTDMFKDIAPELQTYDDLVEAKLIEANKIAKISGDIAEKTRKWAVKNKAEADKLFKFMGETTIQGIDPTKSFEEQKQKAERFYTYADKVAIEYDKKQREALNQEKYDYIKAKWDALSPDAKDIYSTMKNHYERLADKMFIALKTKIVNSIIDEKSKAKLIDKLRLEFESSKVAGPYFPLMRFGEYVVSAKDKDNQLVVERYETPSERDNRAAEMEQEGFSDIKKSADVDKNINLQADTAFMSDILKEIEQSDPLAFESISDDVYQLYLKYLPNLSARKAFIHRKGIQGYSDDMLRVFASKTFHLGRQIANVNYMDKMQEQISNLEKRVKETGDPKLKAIYEDLLKTHDHIVNPQFNELAQNLTSLGFFWYMTSLSAGLLNFTQIAMVVYPKLSGKYGAGKAFFNLNKSIKDLVTDNLTFDEKRFIEEMKDAGIVDLTMTHDLAGLGDHYNDIKYGPLTTVKRVLSIPQHYSEVGNRMVTLLTSYRLAKQNKESNPTKVAIATNYETNFNYTNENRSRWMRGPIQKVAFQFKNYSVQMLYFMMKNTFKALQGDKQALKTMGTLMVVATAIAGVKGLPIQVLYTIAGLAGVDDPEDELYAEIKELFGEYSDVVWRGVLNNVTGADIGGRTGLGDMLLKSPTKEMNTRDTIDHYVTQILGPSLGLITNMALGIEKIIKGDTGKGVEQSMPKPVKDIIQSIRFGNEGARDNDFKPIVEDFKPTELATKAIGFQPERLAAQQESNMRQMRAKQRIDMERSEILKTLRKADFRQDKELWSETMNKIKEFNAKYPSLQIKNDTITKSILNSQKGIDRAEGGLDIAPKYKYETERYK